MRKACVQDIENISSCSFCVYPVVPIRLGKVIKYEAKKPMSIMYLETLNIEKGQIDSKHNRRARVVPTHIVTSAKVWQCSFHLLSFVGWLVGWLAGLGKNYSPEFHETW